MPIPAGLTLYLTTMYGDEDEFGENFIDDGSLELGIEEEPEEEI